MIHLDTNESMIDLSTDIRAAMAPKVRPQYGQQTGINTSYRFEGGRMYINREKDLTRLADFCKALHNEGYHGSSEMKLVAKFDPVLVEKYCNDNGVTFMEFMNNEEHIKRMAENPDNAAFRVWKGAL